MATTNIIIQWSDVNLDSISKAKFRYSRDGVNWTETSEVSFTPVSISPLTVPFNTTTLGIKSGTYYVQVAIFDGILWSNWSASLTLRVSSFVDSISDTYDSSDSSQTKTFTIRSCGTQQQLQIIPLENSSTGFIAQLYKGNNLLQTLSFNGGDLTSKVFTFTPSSSNEEYKVKVIANLKEGISPNIISCGIKLLTDTNNINFSTFFVIRNNPDYQPLIYNMVTISDSEGEVILNTIYPVASNLDVNLIDTTNSEVSTVTIPLGSTNFPTSLDYSQNFMILEFPIDQDTMYIYIN